jgi:hypothetical protein
MTLRKLWNHKKNHRTNASICHDLCQTPRYLNKGENEEIEGGKVVSTSTLGN